MALNPLMFSNPDGSEVWHVQSPQGVRGEYIGFVQFIYPAILMNYVNDWPLSDSCKNIQNRCWLRSGGEQPKATFDTSVLLFLKQIVCHFIEQDNGR